jgi:hypothetical protein
MTVKKMLLLAACMALVALSQAVPAGGSSTELGWYDDEYNVYPTEGEEKEVSPHAVLSITQGGTRFGPCTYMFTGWIWNLEEGMGVGTLSADAAENCGTSIPGCTVTKSTVLNDPWPLTMQSTGSVKFSEIEIQMHLSAGCPAPLTRTAGGSVEGDFVDAVNLGGGNWSKSKVTFTNATGLWIGATPVTLSGDIVFGTKLTAVAGP